MSTPVKESVNIWWSRYIRKLGGWCVTTRSYSRGQNPL